MTLTCIQYAMIGAKNKDDTKARLLCRIQQIPFRKQCTRYKMRSGVVSSPCREYIRVRMQGEPALTVRPQRRDSDADGLSRLD